MMEGNCLVVARGATGIWLILRALELEGYEALVPANLCYAGVYPVVYAGMKPVFCDVDPESGNVTIESVASVLSDRVRAMIIPHMYGNPVSGFEQIRSLCRDRGITLVEDCASAMGATSEAYDVGSMGDYCVYSTGYAKTIDLGYGGLIVSREHLLDRIAELESQLPAETEQAHRETTLFSALYRVLRNQGEGTRLAEHLYRTMMESCRDAFVHRMEENRKAELLRSLRTLPDVIQKRREAWKEYQERLSGLRHARMYPFSPGAVPWRANLLIEDRELRKKVIQGCLDRHLPVSDWYPRVTPMFGEKRCFPGAQWHEEHILNFPLLTDPNGKKEICEYLLSQLAQRRRGI